MVLQNPITKTIFTTPQCFEKLTLRVYLPYHFTLCQCNSYVYIYLCEATDLFTTFIVGDAMSASF